MTKTLFDKIWDNHVVATIQGGTQQIYIDRIYCHEVTSAQAFEGLRRRGLPCLHPERIFCFADHNLPTLHQERPIADPTARRQVETMERNACDFRLAYYGPMHPYNGIIHVSAPQMGLTLPGMTVVCGDSHTSTHGALGTVAFGIGTSEVEMVLAAQSLLQVKPKTMRIEITGIMPRAVTAKDVALFLLSKLGTDGATEHFIEYAGETVRRMSMEERFTLCNLAIEMGARGGLIAPDEKTAAYLYGSEFAPTGTPWHRMRFTWNNLKSDEGACFDREVSFDISSIEPMITYGTNPGMGIAVSSPVPTAEELPETQRKRHRDALEYMGIEEGKPLLGHPISKVFLGSCTNGRIEDFRAFASVVRGRKRADSVTAWMVPGSWKVLQAIRDEGIDRILEEAGFTLRQPGCSACLAMNGDKADPGEYIVSTTNRNFKGRQGPGSRTFLASPVTAAAAAVTGKIINPLDLLTPIN